MVRVRIPAIALLVMDWATVSIDVVLGFLVSGAAAAWVPDSVWQYFFLTSHPTLA